MRGCAEERLFVALNGKPTTSPVVTSKRQEDKRQSDCRRFLTIDLEKLVPSHVIEQSRRTIGNIFTLTEVVHRYSLY